MSPDWKHHTTTRGALYVRLSNGNGCVRCTPSPDGRYLWQFRKTAGYVDTIAEAIDIVESASEFFDIMRRNPLTP